MMSDFKKPGKTYVLFVYTKRIIRWRRSSYPYLSGDAFADLADVVIGGSRWRKRRPSSDQIANARVIFCRSDLLLSFLQDYKYKISAQVIIAGNSDFEFKNELLEVPNSVKAVFLQNSFISDNERIFTLPIGIENFRLGVNGHPGLMKYSPITSNVNREILFGPFGNTHNVRAEVNVTFVNQSGPWQVLRGRVSPRSYAKVSKQFYWIACVRGNGIDTHRFWETLYRGRFPIVTQDAWLGSLDDLNLSTVAVTDWSLASMHNIINSKVSEPFDPGLVEPLWMPYWEKKIQQFLTR